MVIKFLQKHLFTVMEAISREGAFRAALIVVRAILAGALVIVALVAVLIN